MNRYNNIEFILNLHWIDGIDLINKAFEKREENKAWQMWIAKYPWMAKNEFIPFDKFYKKAIQPKNISQKPAQEILKEAYEIRQKLNIEPKGGGSNRNI